jgi:hypothetical protein
MRLQAALDESGYGVQTGLVFGADRQGSRGDILAQMGSARCAGDQQNIRATLQ